MLAYPPDRLRARPCCACCACCTGQSVEVEPGNPHLFWSASEDGTVRQFDTRMRSAAWLLSFIL